MTTQQCVATDAPYFHRPRSYLQKDQMLIKLLVVDINESLALSLEITDNYGKTNENSRSPLVFTYISQCVD